MVVDYVSATATLEAGAKALGRRGRLVTLGGSGKPFQALAADMLNKEQDLLGSRYVTRSEVLESLDLVARGEVFPLVTVVRPLEEAEAVHDLVERGEVIGRAALRMCVCPGTRTCRRSGKRLLIRMPLARSGMHVSATNTHA